MSAAVMNAPVSDNLTLVINLGSSSLKAALIAAGGRTVWSQGRSLPAGAAIEQELEQWLRPALDAHQDAIQRVGHRVVHGGDAFTAPTLITAEVEQQLQALTPLAPLHNPAALKGIAWVRSWAAHLPQWACFDTAFHSNLPEAARTYALSKALREQGFRRYGFHGLNHQHVSETVQEQWRAQGGDPNQLRLISAHLGAGASLAAIRGGVCIDTTMGYTPLEGLVMASRSGSVDPGVLLALMRQGMDATGISDQLQHHGGLKGLSGLSGDMRTIRQQAGAGHQGAGLALAVFRHRLLQLIGAMAASLQGVDVLALTGGIGEHDQELHNELQEALAWLPGLEITVVPADEEQMIARLCLRGQSAEAAKPQSTRSDQLRSGKSGV